MTRSMNKVRGINRLGPASVDVVRQAGIPLAGYEDTVTGVYRLGITRHVQLISQLCGASHDEAWLACMQTELQGIDPRPIVTMLRITHWKHDRWLWRANEYTSTREEHGRDDQPLDEPDAAIDVDSVRDADGGQLLMSLSETKLAHVLAASSTARAVRFEPRWRGIGELAAICSSMAAFLAFRIALHRTNRRIASLRSTGGICLGCGYPLDGLPSSTCPECGHEAPPPPAAA